MNKKYTLSVLTALVAGTMAFGLPGAATAKEPVATAHERGEGPTSSSNPSNHQQHLIDKIRQHETNKDQDMAASMRVRQDIDLLNAKIAAWRAEAADPANKGLVKALEIAINGAIADKLDLLKLAGEYRTSYLKEIDAYFYARIQLLRTGIDYKPFVSPTPAIILPPHHHSYRGPRRAHRTSAEFNLPARPGFGYHFEVEHDPRPRRLHKARKRSGTEMRNRAEPVEHLPSASSTDLETGETTTSQGNGDGTRTVTKTDKRGKVVSKKVRGKKLSKKKRKLRKVKMNKKRFKKLNKRKLRKSKRFKRNKRSAKRMNRRMRMKQRGFRKMRRTRRNRG